MKKFLLFALLPALFLAGCSKDKNNVIPIELDKYSLNLKANDTYQLNVTAGSNVSDVEWKSNNPFIASVTDDGLVRALRVGEAMVTANITPCYITVEPMVNLYTEPFMVWGTSRSTFIGIKGQADRIEGDNLIYLTNNPTSPQHTYMFDSYTLLYASSVLIDKTREEFLYPFLDERYFRLNETTEFIALYADAYTRNEATKLIGVKEYDTNHFEVVYIGQK